MGSPASRSPEEMFGDVVAYIERAREMLASGQWIELKGLDGEIDAVCKAIASLSRDQAKEYLPELEFLREQVEQLEAEMKRQRDMVGDEIKGAGKVQKANKAYAQGSTLQKSEKP